MKDALNRLDQLSRRQFVARAAKTALGVSILPIGAAKPLRAAGGGKAEHVIFFYMSGGMTHMETFDPKPGTEPVGRRRESTPVSPASSSPSSCPNSPSASRTLP